MKHLLDTHIVIRWLLGDRRLTREHVRVLERSVRTATPVGVSALTLWEIAKTVEAGKLKLDQRVDEWPEQIESLSTIEILPLDRHVALESTRLGARFHADPVDQLIAATVRCHRLTLLTSDQNIIDSGVVDVL